MLILFYNGITFIISAFIWAELNLVNHVPYMETSKGLKVKLSENSVVFNVFLSKKNLIFESTAVF